MGSYTPLRSHKLLNKNPSFRHWNMPLQLLTEVVGIQEIPETISAIAITIHCFSKLEGKTLLLKYHVLQTQDLE